MTSKLGTFYKYKHTKITQMTQGLPTSIRYRNTLYKPLKIINPESSPKKRIVDFSLRKYFRKANQLYFDKCFNQFKFYIIYLENDNQKCV